ncbi:MAG: HD domain-containing protein [Clostridiales Family XIII bacterium]|jgi:3'-5' exoribonuclease|nr:HD domain-containing protein [Clostridiales Family XIII bacterium]
MKKEKILFAKELVDVKDGDEICEYFLNKEYRVLKDRNDNDYLSLNLSDKTGDIAAKKWDVFDEDLDILEQNSIIKILGNKDSYNGKAQVLIKRLRGISDKDAIIMSDFLKTAPEPSEELFSFVLKKANEITDEKLKKIVKEFLAENKEQLLYFPAAKSNHHAYFGGLLYHMKRMLSLSEKYLELYKNINRDLIIAGTILHDIGKLWEFDADENGIVKAYTPKGNMITHLIIGIMEFEKKAEKYNLDEEYRMLIEHMILSHHGEPEFGSPVKPAFPEAEILHHIDVSDAKLSAMEEELENLSSGKLSDRLYNLENRHLYKKKG